MKKETVDIDILVTSTNGEKFSANRFPLSYAENNTSGLLNRGRIADLPLLRTLLAVRQKPQQLGINGLFCFISILLVWQLQEIFCNDY